jgi:hypothetical protein
MSQLETVAMFFPAGILHNTTADTWHPFYFRLSPRPSDNDDDSVMRFRSGAHHTEGFTSESEAKAYMPIQTKWKDTGLVWEWDGADVPTVTTDFVVDQFMSTAPQLIEGGHNDTYRH